MRRKNYYKNLHHRTNKKKEFNKNRKINLTREQRLGIKIKTRKCQAK